MKVVLYREARDSDIAAMARIRAAEWESEDYWKARISRYMSGELHPQHALRPRVTYVALKSDALIGFIAGHLTRRYHCDGELEWINVAAECRGSPVASELLRRLAAWFAQQGALRVCVDVEPANLVARRFYLRQGARVLKPHWLVWDDVSTVLARRGRSHSNSATQ